MDQLPERNCKFCGDPFIPRTSKQLYDVLDCRYRQARQVAYEKRQAERVAREAERRRRMADASTTYVPPSQTVTVTN